MQRNKGFALVLKVRVFVTRKWPTLRDSAVLNLNKYCENDCKKLTAQFFFWITDFLLVWDPGGVPYPTLTNTELYRELNSGYRMEKPDMSSDEVYVDRSSDFSICYHGRIIHNVDRKKIYFKKA